MNRALIYSLLDNLSTKRNNKGHKAPLLYEDVLKKCFLKNFREIKYFSKNGSIMPNGSGFQRGDLLAANNIKRFAFRNINTAGTVEIKACGDMSKVTCAAHEAHESLVRG